METNTKERNINSNAINNPPIHVKNTTKLETTKVVDTTYLGLLIAFRKYIDSKHPVYWDFSHELDHMFGNRPVMYNDGNEIGGHCIIPNLDLLGDEFLSEFVKKWGDMND